MSTVTETPQEAVSRMLNGKNELSNIIEKRGELHATISREDRAIKHMKQQREHLDAMLLQELNRTGLKRTATDRYSVSIKEDQLPDVVDWDALYAHILESGDFSLLHRRTSSPAYREVLKAGQQVPGIQPRTHKTINFRTN
jgi:hypothetical protein